MSDDGFQLLPAAAPSITQLIAENKAPAGILVAQQLFEHHKPGDEWTDKLGARWRLRTDPERGTFVAINDIVYRVHFDQPTFQDILFKLGPSYRASRVD